MHRASNFHPEWGFLAPAPGFVRTARVALVATTIGATVGAGVVFSLLAYPTTESAVSVRTLVRPAETALVPPGPMEADEQAVLNPRSPLPRLDAIQLADAVTSRSSASATTMALEGIAVSATTTTATDDTPVKKAAAGSVAVVGVPTRDPTPTKIQSTKKLNATSRYASHGEPLPLVAREHYLKGSLDEHNETAAQVRNRNGKSRNGRSHWDGDRPDQGITSPQGSPEAFLLGLHGIVTRVFGQSSP
jgi:hypothetical protein